MKKEVFCVLLSFYIIINSHAQYQSIDNMLSTYRKDTSDGYTWRNRENTYDRSQLVITKDKLLSTVWITDPFESTQNILVFYKDDVFKIGTMQSGVEITGKYSLVDNSINLFDYDVSSNFISRTGIVNTSTVCKFYVNSSHLIYRDYLTINEKKYYAKGCEQLSGTEIVYNDINVIIESDIKVMNENMKFRNAPNTKGKLIAVYQYAEISTEEVFSLKRGTVVHLLAKTKKTEIIDGVTASWYYIKVYDGFEGFQYGWVFGGYFEKYDKSKNVEYWNQVVEELTKK